LQPHRLFGGVFVWTLPYCPQRKLPNTVLFISRVKEGQEFGEASTKKEI
jgi:hypothetical protein